MKKSCFGRRKRLDTRIAAAGDRALLGGLTLLGIVVASSTPAKAAPQCDPSSLFDSETLHVPTTGNPDGVVVADFNGDGELDFASGDGSGLNVSIFLADGQDGFHPPFLLKSCNSLPGTLVTGHLNSDTVLDLVVCHSGGGSACVYLGVGDGTFEDPAELVNGAGPDVKIADLNNDGHNDLVFGSTRLDAVTLFRGNGTGSFPGFNIIHEIEKPWTVEVAHLDHDGLLDVVTAAYLQHYIVTLRNNGDGTFTQTDIENNYGRPFDLRAIDLNDDGIHEIISANRSDDTMSVFEGFGDGTIGNVGTYLTEESPRDIHVEDLNGDGEHDLAVCCAVSSITRIFLGGSGLTFSSAFDFLDGGGPSQSEVLDYDGDSIPDLLITNASNQHMTVAFGNGDGTFGMNPAFPTIYRVHTLTAANMTAGTDVDVVCITKAPPQVDDRVEIHRGNGDGTFQLWTSIQIPGFYSRCTTADLDNDNYRDIIGLYPSSFGSRIYVLMSNSGVTFDSPVEYETGRSSQELVLGDFDEDGKIDIATADRSDHAVSILLGNGNGTFDEATQFAAGTRPVSIAVGDLNGDGAPDLMTANRDGDDVAVLLNTNDGSGTFHAATLIPVGKSPSLLRLADFNGDDLLDAVVALEETDLAVLLFGDGNGGFPGQSTTSLGVPAYAIEIEDMNGDGIPDLVANSLDNWEIAIATGLGDGTFEPVVTTPSSTGGLAVDIADLDGNGTPDLVYGGGTDFLGSRLNQCIPCAADFDQSGDIGVDDLLQIIAAWGPCSDQCPEDLDASGQVDVDDLLILLGAWGPCT